MGQDRLTPKRAIRGIDESSHFRRQAQPPVLHYHPLPRGPRRKKPGFGKTDVYMPLPFVYRLFRMTMWL